MKCSPHSKLIIWAGSGISIAGPSNLPAADNLTSFILDQCCGYRARHRIASIWRQANKMAFSGSYKNRFGIFPRLEAILNEVSAVENSQQPISNCGMSGFESFASVPYNVNHVVLAKLVNQGVTVITTNFDLCIQRAYEMLFPEENKLNRKKLGNVSVFSPNKSSHSEGQVIHLHGTADDISTLGATIRSIKHGLSDEVKQILESCWFENSVMHIVGYSMSDWFDINPYFINKSKNSFDKTRIVFFQHGDSPCPIDMGRLFEPFMEWKYINGDTTKHLQMLVDEVLPGEKSTYFNWKTEFIKKANLSNEKCRGYYTCAIAYALGINVNRLNRSAIEQTIRNKSLYDGPHVHIVLGAMYRMQNKTNEEEKQYRGSRMGKPDLLGYYYAHRQLDEALKLAASFKEIISALRSNGRELEWYPYTSMSVHCGVIVDKYLTKSGIRKVSSVDKRRSIDLIELAKLLGDRPLKGVNMINQVVTAWRYQLILKSLCYGIVDDELKERIYHLYGEGASIIGFVSAWRDCAITNYFIYKYHHNTESKYKAIEYIERSNQLASLIGDVRGVQIAKLIRSYINV